MSDSPTHLSFEELHLLKGCLAQGRQAQYMLYQHYKTALFSSALRILSNRALIQDALQEAFIDIFQGLTGFQQQ